MSTQKWSSHREIICCCAPKYPAWETLLPALHVIVILNRTIPLTVELAYVVSGSSLCYFKPEDAKKAQETIPDQDHYLPRSKGVSSPAAVPSSTSASRFLACLDSLALKNTAG